MKKEIKNNDERKKHKFSVGATGTVPLFRGGRAQNSWCSQIYGCGWVSFLMDEHE
jgi:hypothetical protein